MLSSYPDQDFRYNNAGTYHNRPTSKLIKRKKAIRRSSGLGPVCPGCGLVRSKQNKCFCNS